MPSKLLARTCSLTHRYNSNKLIKHNRSMSTNTDQYWLINYTYTHDILNKRTPFRAKHLDLIKRYADKHQCILGGR